MKFAVMMITLAIATNVWAVASKNSKISPSVYNTLETESSQRQPILIYLKDKANLSGAQFLSDKTAKTKLVYEMLTEVAKLSQQPIVEILDQEKLSYERFYIANMISIDNADLDLINQLAAREDVATILADEPIENLLPIGDETDDQPSIFSTEGSLVEVGAQRVWQELGVTGRGVVIAGQDTGIQWDHPAIKRQYRGSNGQGVVQHDYNWLDAIKANARRNRCGANLKAPCDDNNHGTHTIGTIVGDDGGTNKIGMAPDAQWIGCRNMDGGAGRPSTYIRCYEFFLAPYPIGGDPLKDGAPDKAPDVINNSWGCNRAEGCQGDEMIDVLAAIKAAGIINVVSAGNDGPSCSTINTQPATHSGLSLTVGAYNSRDGKIASFSSRGPSVFDGVVGPDIAAPGVRIRSAIPGDRYSGSFSGTSMAGPHVVGLVALILSARPDLIGNVDAVTELIRATARETKSSQSCGGVSGQSVPNNTFGFGRIDAYLAVKQALSLER